MVRSRIVLGWPLLCIIVALPIQPQVLCIRGRYARRPTRTCSQLAKGITVHCYCTLVLVLLGSSVVAQECPAPHSTTPVVIHVTHEEYPIATPKSCLVHLLTDSLIDEGRGLVDVAREHQIQHLMKQLGEESLYASHGSHENVGTDDAESARADSPSRIRRPEAAQFSK